MFDRDGKVSGIRYQVSGSRWSGEEVKFVKISKTVDKFCIEKMKRVSFFRGKVYDLLTIKYFNYGTKPKV